MIKENSLGVKAFNIQPCRWRQCFSETLASTDECTRRQNPHQHHILILFNYVLELFTNLMIRKYNYAYMCCGHRKCYNLPQ
jgi:hypothetical protein